MANSRIEIEKKLQEAHEIMQLNKPSRSCFGCIDGDCLHCCVFLSYKRR